ncbi:MAG: hypothetical protein M3406_15060 [Chloroflexota bacterium]|nr:hypothetical protein [Chloroflexota bacterium]
MANERVDWDTLEYLNPGPIPGHWRGRFEGSTPDHHLRVYLDVDAEADPAPEYYEARLTAEYDDIRLPAHQPFTLEAHLTGRKGARGYIIKGARKEERVGVSEPPGSSSEG